MLTRAAALIAALALTSCVENDAPAHGEASDLDPVDWTSSTGKADFSGLPAVFDRNTIMSDGVFTATGAVDGDAVQEFLENSPYGRSWLAGYRLEGGRFADGVVKIASDRGIDPVVLLARMQVESSLVSALSQPSSTHINFALGCGCPDASRCSSEFRGLANQLRCGADVLATQLAASQDGSGGWVKGRSRTTSDPLRVTPSTHATAALYAYTPWVLVGRGGNWLVWNVTRRFLKHFDEAGTLHLP